MGSSLPHKAPIINFYKRGEDVSSNISVSTVKLNTQKEPKIVLTKSDLRNSQWIKEFIFSIKGGAQEFDKQLIESIISKLSESHWDVPSVNKILKKIAEVTLELGSNSRLVRILAELEKPFCYNTFSGIPTYFDILGFPQAEGFTSSTTSLSPYQQRVKTRLLAVDVSIVAQDGSTAVLTDKSTNHLLSKHGDALGINDPLPTNPKQKPTKYKQTRTRVNKENKDQFAVTLSKILQNSKTEVFQDMDIRGIKSKGYYTEDYGAAGFFIGVHTEGEFAGQIMKAQPISREQLEKLKTSNSID